MGYLKIHITGAILAFSGLSAMGGNFLDTSAAPNLVTFGARIGVNSSNVTVSDDMFDLWNKNSWGTGFDLGVVADINIRNYIAIQPGIFFQSRSGDYTYASRFWVPTEGEDGTISNEARDMVQYGHLRSYNIYVPILASVRFNISDKVRWSVDVGPYFNIKLKSTGNGYIYDLRYEGIDKLATLHRTETERRGFDFGFKLGTGFKFFNHYYLSVHYMAGATDAWKTTGMGGRNKAWVFSAGYDF